MDISNLQGGPDVNHWHPVKDFGKLMATGATFFAAKACEGAHTVDDQFERHRDGFRQNCRNFVKAVWYTLLHCEKDPGVQADLLAQVVGELGPRETLCCDFERKSYEKVDLAVMRAHGLEYLEAFYARLDSLGALPDGVRPMIYTSNQHWQVIGNPEWERAAGIDLWVPRYAMPDPEPPTMLPRPWTAWTVFQWTDNDTGIQAPLDGCGACDRNVLAAS